MYEARMTEHQSTYLLAYTGVVAFAILIQGIALVVLALAAAKLMKQVAELTAEAKVKVYPILESVRDITVKGQDIAAKAQDIAEVARNVVRDTEPKIIRVTSNIADTSDVYRAKVAQVDALITDTTGKAQRQSDRVDTIVTNAITKTSETVANIGHAILMPIRQMSGLASGAKTGIESLIAQFTSKSASAKPKRTAVTPEPVAFEGESVYTGYEDDYHA
jgi:methyl-accepting chemotaxis protein